MSAMTLQINDVSAESDTAIKFLVNIINRGGAVLPSFAEGVTDKSTILWLDKVVHERDDAGNIIATYELGDAVKANFKAKPANKLYHLTLSDVRIELTEKSKPEQSKTGRIFQAIDVKVVDGTEVTGAYKDRPVVRVGALA